MDAIKYFEEKKRMLNSVGRMGNKCDGVSCLICPISLRNNGSELDCGAFEIIHPEQAVAIVEEWSQEHPQKTMLSDFLEKYPNAKLNNDGTPYRICPHELGYCDKVDECKPFIRDCVSCWNRPLEE